MGFFDIEQTKSKSRPEGKIYSCASCGLYKNGEHPKMQAFGKGKKGILNIGEAPDVADDQKGKPWQSKIGRQLQRMYKDFGIDLFEDCVNINAVNCLPSATQAPSDYEVTCCRGTVQQVIDEFKPKLIILFGNAALSSVIGSRWKKELGGIGKWRGWQIPDRELRAWVCPVFSPEYMQKQQGFTEVENIWEQDLSEAFACLQKEFPIPEFQDDRKSVQIVQPQAVVPLLDSLPKLYTGQTAYIDYEATGLKPHAKGHRIVCTAISPEPNLSYVFMGPTNKLQRAALSRFLSSPKIGKAAANMKFEHAWSLIRVGVETAPWIWDTMQAAHILDNRPGTTGLKFQAYVQLGVQDYDSHIHHYLSGCAPGQDSKSANRINRIFELVEKDGGKELMMYCGLDALYEHQLGILQMKKLGYTGGFFPPF